MDDLRLSDYGRNCLTPSPVSQMLSQFTHDFRDGIDINLGVGYVNEETIPVEIIGEALKQISSDSRYRQPFNYGSPQGSPNLIASLTDYYLTKGVGGLTNRVLCQKKILIGANGATSILEALADVLPKGIVISAEPLYYIYTEFLERKGFTIVTVPEDRQGMIPEKLKELLDSDQIDPDLLSFAYIITINNPSSSILSNDRRKRIVKLFTEYSQKIERPIPLIFDKAYEDLVHDPQVEKPLSAMLFDEIDLVYELGTLSKVIAPALRMGYLIAPPGDLTQALEQKVSDVGFSAPLMNQEIASWLLDNRLEDQLAEVNGGYREKALVLRPAIDEKLGPWLEECIGGSAGFYFYLTFKTVRTGEGSSFFNYLNRITGVDEVDLTDGHKGPRVIYIPGDFCVHPHGELREKGSRSLRLSYGYESIGNFIKSLDLLAKAADWAQRQGD